jgi:hypothetical protein
MILKLEIAESQEYLNEQTIYGKVSSCVVSGECRTYQLSNPIALSFKADFQAAHDVSVLTFDDGKSWSLSFKIKLGNPDITISGIPVNVSSVNEFPDFFEKVDVFLDITKQLYNAHQEAIGWVDHKGCNNPKFEDLPEATKNNWKQKIQKVIDV